MVASFTHGQSRVRGERFNNGGVSGAGRVQGDGASVCDADGLKLRALFRDDGGVRGTSVVEELGESLADGSDVLRCDAEGGGGKTDLLDEVADLVLVESHEPAMQRSIAWHQVLYESFGLLTCEHRTGWRHHRISGSRWFPPWSSRAGHRNTRTNASTTC